MCHFLFSCWFEAATQLTRQVQQKRTQVVFVLLCLTDPRVRKIRNKASSCPGIFSRTLRFYYVTSSPGSPLPHLLDGHRKFVGNSAISARSCTGPVRYRWGSIVELEVPPDETPGLMTLNDHNTNILQSITHAKSPNLPDRSNFVFVFVL